MGCDTSYLKWGEVLPPPKLERCSLLVVGIISLPLPVSTLLCLSLQHRVVDVLEALIRLLLPCCLRFCVLLVLAAELLVVDDEVAELGVDFSQPPIVISTTGEGASRHTNRWSGRRRPSGVERGVLGHVAHRCVGA